MGDDSQDIEQGSEQAAEETLDTTDVDRWVGVPLGGGRMKDPVATNDVRRWVQGVQNPNPLYYDEEYAAESRFGGIVAPQSFAVCTDDSHGAGPAIQGNIPGQHMLFGGDEWWFHGPRIRPGDKIRQDRMLFDYKVTETKFAGPTMFSRGDTSYVNQVGETVCKQRSTSIRYVAAEAVKRGAFMDIPEKEWSDNELEELEKKKFEYFQDFLELGHDKRQFVKVGDSLGLRPIGPHTIASFTTEWRGFMMSIWGTFKREGPTSLWSAGWLPEMDRDHEGAEIDPSLADGLYKGPSRGHVQKRYAELIGMPRGYGYGATMGAWIIDYLTNWGGEWSEVVHSKMSYRSPALIGDATYLSGEVTQIGFEPETGSPIATVNVTMTNQREEIMASGDAEIRLPNPD
jgi:acyl dehydratase